MFDLGIKGFLPFIGISSILKSFLKTCSSVFFLFYLLLSLIGFYNLKANVDPTLCKYQVLKSAVSVWIWIYSSKVHINFHRYEYRWADGEKIKKPIEVSAPKYVELLMDWIEGQLDNESIFPQRLGKSVVRFVAYLKFSPVSFASFFHQKRKLQGHHFLPISRMLWRQYSKDCSEYMPTSITLISKKS